MEKPKNFKEVLATLLEERSREKLRELLQQQVGETAQLDFKASWPEFPDLARHALALANSGGGCVVAGVAELPDKSIDPVGLPSFTDKVDLRKGIQKYLSEDTKNLIDIQDFNFEASEYNKLQGKKFQIMFIEFKPEKLPHVCAKGNEKKLREAAIYVRRGEQSVEVSQSELDKILNERIESSYSSKPEIDLRHHIEQLKVLHQALPGPSLKATFFSMSSIISSMYEKPFTPKEEVGPFLLRMIERKQKRIEQEIDQ